MWKYAVAAAILLGACDSATGPLPERSDEPLQTDRMKYVARYVGGEGAYRQYGFTVVATFTNRTNRVSPYLARAAQDDVWHIRRSKPTGRLVIRHRHVSVAAHG